MDVIDFDLAGGLVAVAAVIGLLLALPLYLSQRRDVHRLRTWMEREPSHPVEDIAASEALLDRAEAELEELTGATPAAAPGAAEVQPPPSTPATPIPAATRVTSERPALERITMERAALEPHPRWRRFAARVTQPRVLATIGIVGLLVGIGAIFASERLLSVDENGEPAKAGAVNPEDVNVVVLNGTTAEGLAGLVADDLRAKDYNIPEGGITNARSSFDQTVVMFAPGNERAARKVARELDVTAVQAINAESRRAVAGLDPDVVVIAGEDRARS
jgi:LytR cell envelope-related transcriptional attenuator